MKKFIILLSKEWRQNMVIYVVPFIFLLVLFLYKQNLPFLTSNWAGILAVAVPIALAVSYGLQAFDLEENGQTRDYLLTKPLSVGEIIWSKYICGLFILLLLTYFWYLFLIPKALEIPSLSDYSTMWFSLYIFLLVIVFSASFTMGVFIKGPQKFIFGIIFSLIVFAWFFDTLFEYTTWIFLSDLGAQQNWGAFLVLLIGSVGFLIFTGTFLQKIAQWHLQNLSMQHVKKQVVIFVAIVIILPILFHGINILTKPAIRPFDSMALSIAGIEDWFITIDVLKQPQGDVLACADRSGKLGFARFGEKPHVVYKSSQKGYPLTNLAWSPSGSHLAFSDNERIKIFRMKDKKIIDLIEGNIPFWSADGQKMLIASELRSNNPKDQTNTQGKSYRFYLVDFVSSRFNYLKDLQFLGSAMMWDSEHNRLLALDKDWNFISIDLTTGKTQGGSIIPAKQRPIMVEIIPVWDRKTYRIALFSINIDTHTHRKEQFNLFLYEFNPETQKMALIYNKLNIFYEDMILDLKDRVAFSMGNGVYRLPKTGGKK